MSDSLVATRARRANAGSRLKQLIEAEELLQAVQQLTFISEDDENVNLLFQEDENDEEFEASSEEDGEEDNDDDDDENDQENSQENGETSDVDSKKRKHETGDEDLSDSELSATDDDESEGERELHKEELAKKKKQRKKKSLIPEIRRPVANGQKKPVSTQPKKQKLEFTAESLLTAERSSSRASVKASKRELAERLRADEARRASMKPVAKVEYIEMTQEERLREAVETEKANIIALQQFREQEIVKKETQRQLLHLRRALMLDVIRYESRAYYKSPNDEVDEAREIRRLELIKMKRRPGRKRKIELDIPDTRIPGDVDKTLPYYQKYLAGEEESKSDDVEMEGDSKSGTAEPENEAIIKKEPIEEGSINDEQGEAVKGEVNGGSTGAKGEAKETSEDAAQEGEKVIDNTTTDSEMNTDKKGDNGLENVGNMADSEKSPHTAENLDNPEPNSSNPKTIEDGSQTSEINSLRVDKNLDLPKRVKFADLHNEEYNDKASDKGSVDPELAVDLLAVDSPAPESLSADFEVKVEDKKIKTEEVFEGPLQKICQNLIFFLDFQDKVTISDERKYLFGEQALLPASRRFRDLKTIARIGEINNPYVTIEEKKDELFEPASDLTLENSFFEDLKRLPRFGDFSDIVEEEEENKEESSGLITIKTEAPNSLYLPNGNKKFCLISNVEAKIFDPANGMCFSSQEVAQEIRKIEQGKIPWYSFGGDVNDYGRAEIYLGNRDGQRHAKGVPDGFGGV